jgi:TolB protein
MRRSSLPVILALAAAAAGLLQAPAVSAAATTHTRLVFALGAKLMSASPQGGGMHRIGRLPHGVIDMSAAENGHRIAVLTNQQVPFPGKGSIRTIYLVRPGHGLRRVLRLHTQGDHRIAMSHDGRRIAFGKDNELWVSSAKGGPAHRVTSCGGSNAYSPAFSSDDRNLVFTCATGNAPSIYRVGLAGGTAQRLTPQGINAISESVSRRGPIVFRQDPSGGGSERLRVMNSDGSGVRTVATSDDPRFNLEPDFAPSGRSIVFLRLREVNGDRSPRRYSIRTVRSSGINQRLAIGGLGVRPRGLQWTRVP